MAQNYNPDIRARAEELLKLKGQNLTQEVSDTLQLTLDVTPPAEAGQVTITDGTDSLLINTDGSINAVTSLFPSGGTPVFIRGTGTGASQNAYTVTTGKSFYIYSVWHGGVAGAHFTDIYDNAGTTVQVELFTATASQGESINGGGMPLSKHTSGQVVKVTATNAMLYGINGVEI